MPHRSAAFASLCGVNPIPASSGKIRTGIASTVVATVRPTPLSIASSSSGYVTSCGPRHTCQRRTAEGHLLASETIIRLRSYTLCCSRSLLGHPETCPGARHSCLTSIGESNPIREESRCCCVGYWDCFNDHLGLRTHVWIEYQHDYLSQDISAPSVQQ